MKEVLEVSWGTDAPKQVLCQHGPPLITTALVEGKVSLLKRSSLFLVSRGIRVAKPRLAHLISFVTSIESEPTSAESKKNIQLLHCLTLPQQVSI